MILKKPKRADLFILKELVLHSGGTSAFKIECDALTDHDIECLAYLIHNRVKFYNVVGVPTGGVRLANALKKYMSHASESNTWLIVDDVFTTGKSMELAKEILVAPDKKDIQGFVIFARSECPAWITPVFKMI